MPTNHNEWAAYEVATRLIESASRSIAEGEPEGEQLRLQLALANLCQATTSAAIRQADAMQDIAESLRRMERSK